MESSTSSIKYTKREDDEESNFNKLFKQFVISKNNSQDKKYCKKCIDSFCNNCLGIVLHFDINTYEYCYSETLDLCENCMKNICFECMFIFWDINGFEIHEYDEQDIP